MRPAGLACVLAVAALMGGCSGNGGQVAEPSPRTSLRAYVAGISTYSVKELDAAVRAAQPGSPAAQYAEFVRQYRQADIDGGVDVANATVSSPAKIAAGYLVCWDADVHGYCFKLTHITFDRGRVADYLVDGESIRTRVRVGGHGAKVIPELGASIRFVAASTATMDHALIVVLELKAGQKTGLTDFNVLYRPTGGRWRFQSRLEGPTHLAPGVAGRIALTFDRTRFGGTVQFRLRPMGGGPMRKVLVTTR